MTSRGTAAARLRGLPPLVWVVAVLIVVTGLVAACGGFAPGQDRGRPVAAGEQILLQRWRLQVDRAALVDDSYPGSDPAPRLQIRLRTEFTGHETLCCLSERMIEVRYGGQTVTRNWPAAGELRSGLGFDPAWRWPGPSSSRSSRARCRPSSRSGCRLWCATNGRAAACS